MDFVPMVFGSGVVGALAPEVVRLYGLRNNPNQGVTGFYIFISCIFAALGGFMAVILPATTLWGAFYVGISTPTLISTALKKGIEMRDQPQAHRQRRPDANANRQPASLKAFIRAL